MASGKSAEAFRTISEAATEIGVPQHVLRHWEEVFGQIRPMRRAGGRRYYRPHDLDILRGVKVLLYDRRYTTKGVQQIFKEHGAKHVAELGREGAVETAPELRPLDEELVLGAGDIHVNGAAAPAHDDDILQLTAPIAVDHGRRAPVREQDELTPAMHDRLAALLARLERVQEALDEATLALEAIEAAAQPGGRRR